MKKTDLICTIKIKDRHGNVVGQKEVVKYEGLLAKAHEEGLEAIGSKLVQLPEEDNGHVAVVHASVRTRKGRFEGLGDASAQNVGSRMAPHLIRMAETRAKARALRDAVNIGAVSVEELVSELEAEEALEPTNGGESKTPQPSTHPASPRGAPMTDAQRRYLFRLLAEKGLGAEQARERLHTLLGVESLEQATKHEASSLIDQIQRGSLPDGLGAAEA